MQILEATNVQEELVRNLQERLSGGYNQGEKIELKLQQKGIPFLNFEISKACLTYLMAPSLIPISTRPERVTDLYITTMSVKDFCLMNQEKVSQPQILLRSSNYLVDQAYHPASNMMKDRAASNSFDRSSERHQEAHKKFQFDLEDEDNMAMVDQAVEETDEFFVRLTFGSSILSKFETQQVMADSQVQAEDEPAASEEMQDQAEAE